MVVTQETVMESLLAGRPHLVPLSATSSIHQKSSTTALAVLNFVRVALKTEDNGTGAEVILNRMTRRDFLSDVTSICLHGPEMHDAGLDLMLDVPLFKAELKCLGSYDGLFSKESTAQALIHLAQPTKNPFLTSARAIIFSTGCGHIACLRITRSPQNIFVVFNPQARQTGGTAVLYFHTSINDVERYVEECLLATGNNSLTKGKSVMRFNCLVFEHSASDIELSEAAEQAMLDANLHLLSLMADANNIRAKNMELARENDWLQRTLNSRANAKGKKKAVEDQNPDRNGIITRSFAPPLIFFDDDAELIRAVPQQRSQPNRNSSTSADRHFLSTWDMPPIQEPQVDEDEQRSLALAARLSREFAEEDANIRQQAVELSKQVQVTFECSVCMDRVPEDDVARMDGCRHTFCRGCIRQYIVSKIEERNYPIPCPICTTEKGNKDSGVVSAFVVEMIGISERTFRIYEELQLNTYSIPVECRKCKRTTFVDRVEYQAATVIFCPLPRCQHRWCKACQQAVDPDEEEHSCDGTREMQRLMRNQHWKFCPGCRTPTERTYGCNHMTCRAPGCNTHFCYVCGDRTDTRGGHHCRGQQP